MTMHPVTCRQTAMHGIGSIPKHSTYKSETYLYLMSGPSLPVPVELVSGDVFIVAPEYVDAPEC